MTQFEKFLVLTPVAEAQSFGELTAVLAFERALAAASSVADDLAVALGAGGSIRKSSTLVARALTQALKRSTCAHDDIKIANAAIRHGSLLWQIAFDQAMSREA